MFDGKRHLIYQVIIMYKINQHVRIKLKLKNKNVTYANVANTANIV